MNNMTLTLMALFATTSISISSGLIAGWGQGTKPQSMATDFYCGTKLANQLAAICNFEENYEKRSGTMYGNLLRPYYAHENRMNQVQEFEWPLIKSHKAREMSLRSRGKRDTGVVEECCDKPCTMDELMTYC